MYIYAISGAFSTIMSVLKIKSIDTHIKIPLFLEKGVYKDGKQFSKNNRSHYIHNAGRRI